MCIYRHVASYLVGLRCVVKLQFADFTLSKQAVELTGLAGVNRAAVELAGLAGVNRAAVELAGLAGVNRAAVELAGLAGVNRAGCRARWSCWC